MSSFRQGDIVIVPFDPSVGHEPKKTRPAIVVSNDTFNAHCALCWVVPVTSTDNGYPLHVRLLETNVVEGFAAVEELRSLDLESREAMRVGSLDSISLSRVLNLARLSL